MGCEHCRPGSWILDSSLGCGLLSGCGRFAACRDWICIARLSLESGTLFDSITHFWRCLSFVGATDGTDLDGFRYGFFVL